MFKVPDNSIAQSQSEILKDRIEHDIEGYYLTILCYMITDLPTDRTVGVKQTYTLFYYFTLFFEILLKRIASLVRLANIVRRRGYNEFHALIRQLTHEREIVRALNDWLAILKQLDSSLAHSSFSLL